MLQKQIKIQLRRISVSGYVSQLPTKITSRLIKLLLENHLGLAPLKFISFAKLILTAGERILFWWPEHWESRFPLSEKSWLDPRKLVREILQ